MKLTSGWERKSEINSPQNIYVGIKKSHLKIENCKQESTTSEWHMLCMVEGVHVFSFIGDRSRTGLKVAGT